MLNFRDVIRVNLGFALHGYPGGRPVTCKSLGFGLPQLLLQEEGVGSSAVHVHASRGHVWYFSSSSEP